MERELTRRCRRSVRVAEFVTVDAFSATRTGGDAASSADRKTPLFAGYVEVLYARNAWLAVRVDIWMSRDVCHRQGSADGGQSRQWTTIIVNAIYLQLPICVLAILLQSSLRALQAATSQRTKFEYEMLQHHPELEMLVLRSESIGNYVLFALPLLGEKPQWDPKKLVETEDLDSVFIPDGFHAPNFTVSTNGLTIFIGYPMEEETKSDGAWPLSVEWPARMLLSSQVTLTPPFSKGQSSVELVASCRKWRRRKDFIAELRRHVIVLEYDAVDFSQVFFLLQEQLNDQAPLRILVLRLQFTAAYFLTNCTSDLQVNLLDGEAGAAPVTVALAASGTPPSPDPSADSQACVVQFLESTRKSLLRLFYGE
ncbi:hypothetical protein GQ600_9481 [Phytophthora cactorum]|nr:hypothetical protein GQ600_9481 [Phytophthora cactorum]